MGLFSFYLLVSHFYLFFSSCIWFPYCWEIAFLTVSHCTFLFFLPSFLLFLYTSLNHVCLCAHSTHIPHFLKLHSAFVSDYFGWCETSVYSILLFPQCLFPMFSQCLFLSKKFSLWLLQAFQFVNLHLFRPLPSDVLWDLASPHSFWLCTVPSSSRPSVNQYSLHLPHLPPGLLHW